MGTRGRAVARFREYRRRAVLPTTTDFPDLCGFTGKYRDEWGQAGGLAEPDRARRAVDERVEDDLAHVAGRGRQRQAPLGRRAVLQEYRQLERGGAVGDGER